MCLSFQLHRGAVALAKSTNPGRIEENLKALQLKLDPEEMRQLRDLDRGFRYIKVSQSA